MRYKVAEEVFWEADDSDSTGYEEAEEYMAPWVCNTCGLWHIGQHFTCWRCNPLKNYPIKGLK